MVRRFHIEDLIVQDASGVIFRALDMETDRIVALRRFFPFGPDGGGLSPDEQRRYRGILEKLESVSHPCLRVMICGDCDPVDGMPFVATEWMDGETLESIMERELLAVEEVIGIIHQVLEICGLISEVLADEAAWVDTAQHSILAHDGEGGRSFTYWPAPLKHLGAGEGSRGFESIADLAEKLGAWNEWDHDKPMVRGLGGWIHWLRLNAAETNLADARQALATFITDVPSSFVVMPPPRSSVEFKKPAARRMPGAFFWVNALLVLACAGLTGWWWTLKQREKKSAAVATVQAPPAVPVSPPSVPVPQVSAIQSNDHAALARNDGKNVIVEGTLMDVMKNDSGKAIILYFTKPVADDGLRALIRYPGVPPVEIKTEMDKLIGKKIRISGKVVIVTTKRLKRPDIEMPDRESVKLAP